MGVAARWRAASLRARLTAVLVALLLAACAVVGVVTTLALRDFLVSRLDAQLVSTGTRYAVSLEHQVAPQLPDADGDDAGLGDERGQVGGTLGVRLVGGVVQQAGVVGRRAGSTHLSASDVGKLAALPTDGRPRDVDLAAVGDYRVIAVRGADSDTLIAGLPLAGVHATLTHVVVVDLVVFGCVLLLASAGAAALTGVAVRPIRRVASTATAVSELPLVSGEVTLPAAVPVEAPGSEVGQLAAAFNRMLLHVQNALAARHETEDRLRQFVADASHELRTPVATIRGHAELARREKDLPPAAAEALRRVEAESVRMGVLVDDLLLLARLDAGRQLECAPVDLTRIVIDAASDARVSAPGHHWRLELPDEPVEVLGDAHRLHQVLANLLDNARRHTPPGTTVTVGLRRGGDDVELRVVDDGPGIPAAVLPTVFERFVRADVARARTSGGTGLGLAIVSAVVAAHGGRIEVSSLPGRTEFVVRLPGSADAGRPTVTPAARAAGATT